MLDMIVDRHYSAQVCLVFYFLSALESLDIRLCILFVCMFNFKFFGSGTVPPQLAGGTGEFEDYSEVANGWFPFTQATEAPQRARGTQGIWNLWVQWLYGW